MCGPGPEPPAAFTAAHQHLFGAAAGWNEPGADFHQTDVDSALATTLGACITISQPPPSARPLRGQHHRLGRIFDTLVDVLKLAHGSVDSVELARFRQGQE